MTSSMKWGLGVVARDLEKARVDKHDSEKTDKVSNKYHSSTGKSSMRE